MTRLRTIEQEPKIGRSLQSLARDRSYLDFFPLDDAADLDRPGFFYPESPEPGTGPFGHYMLSPGFRRYRTDPVVAYAIADVHVIGADGIVVLDDGVLRDTLDYISTWLPESNTAEFRRSEYLKLREQMPVADFIEDGQYVIGFSGAWRNYGHWLLQCLPKLFAFTLLRRRFRDLKVALPAFAPESAQQRTLDLLGIGPEMVHTLPAERVTGFATAILLPNLDIWSVSPFVAMAAEQLIAGLDSGPAPAVEATERLYVHRTVNARQVANFDAVRALVERYGFTVRSFEVADLAEQVAVMQGARYVISEHGANTTNILFCREGARVLELFNPFSVEPAFWSAAARRGLDYGYLIGNHSPTKTNPQQSWNSAYEVPPDMLESAIRVMLNETPREAVTTASAPTPPPHQAAVAVPPATPDKPGTPAGNSGDGAATGRPSGIREPIFEVVTDVGRFGHGDTAERLSVFSAAMPPHALELHREADMPAGFIAEHYEYAAPQSVNAYALPRGVVWSNGLITQGSEFVAPNDCIPGYFRPHMQAGGPSFVPMHAGAIGREDVDTLALDFPVATALHPNIVYGHFLLEMLPRLYLLMVLRQYGAAFPLVLSSKLPQWARTFVDMFQPADQIISYDHTRQRITAPAIVIPSMMHTSHNFHPAMNLMIHEMVRAQSPAGGAAVPSASRLYVSRTSFGDERLDNADQVEELFSSLGFAIVRLQQLSVEEQIRLFSGAKVIAGEYGYGLHNAIFAGPGTRVIAINFFNNYQSKIARLRGHHLAYVAPEGGNFYHWRLSREVPRKFSVDIALLRRTVQEMLDGID